MWSGWNTCQNRKVQVSLVLISSQSLISNRPEDEHHGDVKPDRIVDNLAQAVNILLEL